MNGPASVVISGDADAVAQVAGSFAGRGVRMRPLRVVARVPLGPDGPDAGGAGEVAGGLEPAAPRVRVGGGADR